MPALTETSAPRRARPGLHVIALGAVALASARAAVSEDAPRPGRVAVESGPADRRRAERVPAIIAAARAGVSRKLGLSASAEVRVRLLRRSEAFVGPPETPLGKPVELYAGVAYPDSATIHIDARALDTAARADALARTLRHEFLHLAVGHSLGRGKLPKWFEEGLACAFGSPLSSRDLAGLAGGRVFPLSALQRRFPTEKRSLSVAYAQSESVVRFIIRERSIGAVRELLGRVAGGEPFEGALEAATGYDLESLEGAWRRSLETWRGWWILRTLFAPSRLFVWTALLVVVGYFVVRRRRRRAAEDLDAFP